MKRETILLASMLTLTGCYDTPPTKDEAFQLGKRELSMALCGDKSASCFIVQGGSSKVSERKNDNTYGASTTFRNIVGKEKPLDYQEGIVFFDIDAKNKAVYVKSIEAWSTNGSKSIRLCGHNYKFCKS
ncbi:hypothetical protein G5Y54_001826 [Salmonella enterica]|nr:hypothetical protein [Salmonella enterica subsp. enterica serovar Agona]ECZ7121070.1 hypothetical protein [Salmonella enterica]EEO4824472.1 hypothetical protein [Salmonella enterica]EEO4865780.1 hypothetical protein [Salmonella enterica]EEO5099284.1 hypothetical protein [Salmonella enterica]